MKMNGKMVEKGFSARFWVMITICICMIIMTKSVCRAIAETPQDASVNNAVMAIIGFLTGCFTTAIMSYFGRDDRGGGSGGDVPVGGMNLPTPAGA